MRRRLLVLFAREPALGRAKTRLAGAIGDKRAAELYGAFLADLGVALPSAGEWTLRVASADGCPAPLLASLLPGWEVVPQSEGDLGERLAEAFRAARAERFDAAAVAGSDAPLLTAADVRGAFDAIEEGADAAFAPAPDGGFSLVALRCGTDAAALFGGVRWSTQDALADCLARAKRLDLVCTLLPEVGDVDVASDLEVLRASLASHPQDAPETARLLSSWDAA